MTDLRTALPPIILHQLSNSGDRRAKGVQFHSSITQLWFCFSIISFLTVTTRAVSVVDPKDLKECLDPLKGSIEKSDAMLYAPSIDNITDSCEDMLLKCYLLELVMVLQEEDVDAECIYEANHLLQYSSVGCLPCEAFSLQNVTVFLDSLNNLLEKLNWKRNT